MATRIGSIAFLFAFIIVTTVAYLLIYLSREQYSSATDRHQRFPWNGSDEDEARVRDPVILVWTKFFSEDTYVQLAPECPYQNCIITYNRSILSESQLLVFHFIDIDETDMPWFRSPDQIWLLFALESPVTTSSFSTFNGLFNWTATYRMDSDVWTPYDHVMKINEPLANNSKNYWKGKTKMVSWFNSHCSTIGGRETFVSELKKYIQVDIYGTCGDLRCEPKMSSFCYQKVSREYFFYLAFENSICKDYITEKFFHILKNDMVPVVFGGGNYSAVAPPGSYIDALSFKSPNALAEHLKKISENETLYNTYFAWRRTHALGGYHWVCELCRRLTFKSGETNELFRSKTYTDLNKWWRDDAKCLEWTSKGLQSVK